MTLSGNQKRKTLNRRAQTALELAIFGGVVVYLVGLIVSSAFQSGHRQSFRYKAMRKALLMSFTNSEALRGYSSRQFGRQVGNSGRNSASIIVIEDRLTPKYGKHLAIDRNAITIVGSGTHSRNFFLRAHNGEFHNLPHADYFINGVYFPFTAAFFRSMTIPNDDDPDNPNFPDAKRAYFFEKVVNRCVAYSRDGINCDLTRDGGDPTFSAIRELANSSADPPFDANCDAYDEVDPFYSNLVDADGDAATPAIPVLRRFDLDLSGVRHLVHGTESSYTSRGAAINGTEPDTPYDCSNFSWQWAAIPFTEIIADPPNSDERPGAHTQIDIDGDLLEESIILKTPEGEDWKVIYMDNQAGDFDLSVTASTLNSQGNLRSVPGLSNSDAYIISKASNPEGDSGTYFLMEEGRLYLPTQNVDKQFIRTVSKKDTHDLVQRRIVVSNNTFRFCHPGVEYDDVDDWKNNELAIRRGTMGTWTPTDPDDFHPNPALKPGPDIDRIPIGYSWSGGTSNPVAHCTPDIGGCFDTDNIAKTCMVVTPLDPGRTAGDNPGPPQDYEIFVRSNIVDRRGRKWITDTSRTPYVEFQTRSLGSSEVVP